jgi:CHASE2 domain-containing sensor protein
MKKIITVLLIFLAFKAVVFLAYMAYEHLPLQLIHFEHFAIEDVEFNDIYYNTRDVSITDNKEVVLINSGSIPNNDRFRECLAMLIEKTARYDPACIGIDLTFETYKNRVFDSTLQATILRYPKIVLSTIRNNVNKQIFKGKTTGLVNLTIKTGESIRHCYNYVIQGKDTLPSFAMQLARFKNKSIVAKDSVSYLKYSSDRKGYYDYFNDKINPMNFAAIEAIDLMNNNIDTAQLRLLLDNKIVIIGHLGNGSMNNAFDIEDKFRVPTDTTLINRAPVMPGAVIHANATQMMLSDDKFFEVKGWLNTLLNSAILLLFLYLFYTIHHHFKLGKAINLLIILGCTIPMIYIFCVLLMDAGIYYKVGALFMQIAFLEEFIEVADGFKKKFTKKNTHD